MAVVEKIKNSCNLLHHQHLTSKATVHENTTSAHRPAQPGPGYNTCHTKKLHTPKLRLIHPWLKLNCIGIFQCLMIRPLELTKFTTSYFVF